MSASIVYAATSGFACHTLKTLFWSDLNLMPETDENNPVKGMWTETINQAAKEIELVPKADFSLTFLNFNAQPVQNFGNYCVRARDFGAREIAINLNTIDNIKGASKFFIYRELLHFKHNTSFLSSLTGLVAAAVSSVALSVLLPKSALLIPVFGISPPVCLATLIGTCAMQIFFGIQERKLEDTAWSKCSKEEQKDTIDYFTMIIERNQEWRSGGTRRIEHFYRKLMITSEGNYRFYSLFHRSLTGRVADFKRSVKQD